MHLRHLVKATEGRVAFPRIGTLLWRLTKLIYHVFSNRPIGKRTELRLLLKVMLRGKEEEEMFNEGVGGKRER